MAEEAHWARVRAAMAAVALRKGVEAKLEHGAVAVVRDELAGGAEGGGVPGARVE